LSEFIKTYGSIHGITTKSKITKIQFKLQPGQRYPADTIAPVLKKHHNNPSPIGAVVFTFKNLDYDNEDCVFVFNYTDGPLGTMVDGFVATKSGVFDVYGRQIGDFYHKIWTKETEITAYLVEPSTAVNDKTAVYKTLKDFKKSTKAHYVEIDGVKFDAKRRGTEFTRFVDRMKSKMELPLFSFYDVNDRQCHVYYDVEANKLVVKQ